MNADWNKVAETARAGIDNPQVKNAYKAQDDAPPARFWPLASSTWRKRTARTMSPSTKLASSGKLNRVIPQKSPDGIATHRRSGESKSIIYRRGIGVVQERVPEEQNSRAQPAAGSASLKSCPATAGQLLISDALMDTLRPVTVLLLPCCLRTFPTDH